MIRFLAFACVCVVSFSTFANDAVPDAWIVAKASLVASNERVELYSLDAEPPSELAQKLSEALGVMEAVWGSTLDTATLGPKIRVYVSSSIRMSHVWRGYEHQADPKAILFLNPRVAKQAMNGTNATYAHELAHLLTWRFHSHTLREGLADYLARAVHP